MKNIGWGLVCFFSCLASLAQSHHKNPLLTKNPKAQKVWVDSIYSHMTLEEKIGQLFMVSIFSNKSKKETNYITQLVKKYHIGGVIFSKGGPVRQAQLTNTYQAASKVPLLIGMDAEWGLAMRLDSTYAFPWNMTLGAIDSLKLVERTGAQIGAHCKRLGVQINFAPDVDVNNNPDNPIIGNRSFGEDKRNVTQKAIAFMKGMESQGVLSSAKHFPGHGDTDVDSHKALPTLNFSKKRLDSLELYPFRKMIAAGVSSIMVGHLNVPALDSRPNFPSSLSKPIITGLLQKKLKYKGLVFTDALNMHGVADYEAPGKTDLQAFLAGNDILLMPIDVKKGIQKIKNAYNQGIVTEKRLARSVRKILMAKYKAGLNNYKPVDTTYLVKDLNSLRNDLLYSKLMENAITVVKNDKAVLPIKHLEKKNIAYVEFGDDSGDAFLHELKKYAKVDKLKTSHLNELLDELNGYNFVIIGFHKKNDNPWQSYKFTQKELVWIHEIARQNTTVLNVFARPYALLDLRTNTNIEGIVMSYQNSKIAQEKTAQILFGALGAKGKLPVSAGKDFPVGTQYKTKPLKRLAYGIPESVGMSTAKLQKIDAIANEAVEQKMTPGLQLLVARKGKVIYRKNYGYHTYKKKIPVTDGDVYDLASMTKILATLPLLMELEQNGVISLKTKLKQMLPMAIGSNKANATLKLMLSHYARFTPWIPFYLHTMNPKTHKASMKYYRDHKSGIYNIKVAENFYMRGDYRDSIYKAIIDSDLLPKKEYKYSDLPYYLMKKYLENHYHSSLDYLTQKHFYQSLGANKTGYLPQNFIDLKHIVPTEIDDYWRDQKIHGNVQDQGAAMLGGVSGHAGLFSNANDVAKIMQMYLNGGYYGGKRYFSSKTIDKFNTCYYCGKDVRRGVGFDKPQLEGAGPTCGCVSMKSFGHTGYTGTIGWADPDKQIVYVFLSNRTFPDSSNRKLITQDIRTRIQKLIYEAILY